MSNFAYDPDALAERLDALLPPGARSPSGTPDDPLTYAAARIAAAPMPRLTPDAFARIQAQVLEASLHVPAQPRLRLSPRVAVALVIAGLLALTALVVALLIQRNTVSVPAPPSTATITLTLTPTSTFTPTPAPTATPSPMPTVITTTPDAAVAPPSITPANASAVAYTIEGPVQSIEGSVVTIFDTPVLLPADEPLLAVLQPGDVLRVQGTRGVGEVVVVVVTVTQIEIVNVEVNVSESGEVWRDDGGCDHPPPPWAPAHGWRRRCEGGGNTNSGGHRGGRDDDDDD